MNKKYWLIYYSQTESAQELTAMTVSDIHLDVWFADLINEFPEENNKLLFAIEIDEDTYNRLKDEV